MPHRGTRLATFPVGQSGRAEHQGNDRRDEEQGFTHGGTSKEQRGRIGDRMVRPLGWEDRPD